jgi:hypothetical protein
MRCGDVAAWNLDYIFMNRATRIMRNSRAPHVIVER